MPAPFARRGRRFAAVLVAAVLLGIPGVVAAAAFTAQIINGANVFSSGTVVLQSTTGAGACVSTGATITNDVASCSGGPWPTGPVSTTTASATSTITDLGAISPSVGSMGVTGCAPQEIVNAVNGTNVGFPFAGVSFGQSMSPLATTAVSLNGTSAWVETNQSDTPGQTFAVAAWFETSAPQGVILGFSANQTDTGATTADRLLWLDASGHLVWGAYNARGNEIEVTSPAPYADGQWHYVVATVGHSGDQLYVDGALVASKGAKKGTPYTGYWTLGWGSVAPAGWTNAPTSPYLNGDLAQATVFSGPLSAAQVATLYAEPSPAAYAAQATTDGASQLWALDDTGLATYAGLPPGFSSSSPTLADATGNGDTGTLLGTGTLGTPGPLGGDALSLPGTAGSLVSTPTAFNDPHPLSQSIGFQTTTSGSIMGFTTQSTDNPTPVNFDRMFWIDPTGHLVYAVYSPDVAGSYTEVTSPGTYADGQWHLAVATVGPAGTLLYVDGALVAQNTTALHPQVFTGYWHLGYAYTRTWSDAPTSDYLNGSIAHAAVFPTQLTGAQVASLYAAGSSAAEESTVLGLSPTAYWPLQDQALSAPCAMLQVAAQITAPTATCVYPTLTCSTPSTPLSGFAGAAFTPPPTTGPDTLTLRLSTSSTPNAYQSGLQLLVPFTIEVTQGGFTATVDYATATIQL